MDLFAEMLLAEARPRREGGVRAEGLCPPFRRRFSRIPWLGRRRTAFNADRLFNRLWDYPRFLRRRAAEFDLFHVCDHSYAQLVHALPADRSGVYCHDLDTFRCLLEPAREPRPRWFRAAARRVLSGLQKAALVFYSTGWVREQIEAHGLIDPGRLVHAPPGVAPEFTACPSPLSPSEGERGEGPDKAAPFPAPSGRPFLLHVGSCIPRKRIDVLLSVFAMVRQRFADLVLVQIGGRWTEAQQEQIERLGIGPAVLQARGLARDRLAALYRRAAVVLQPSEAEGFGLPLAEALACGAIVVASDLPVLREVGGPAAVYCPVGDIPGWAAAASEAIAAPESAPPRAARLAQARRYSWSAHADAVLSAYRRLLDR
jgi:glycosyltransferase involved in cell wall biosynthesis